MTLNKQNSIFNSDNIDLFGVEFCLSWSKLDPIQKAETPPPQKELMKLGSFLEMANINEPFIQNSSSKSAKLRKLHHKESKCNGVLFYIGKY